MGIGFIRGLGGGGGNIRKTTFKDVQSVPNISFSELNKMPTRLSLGASVVVGSKIYLLGGYTSRSYVENLCYNTEDDSWTVLADLPRRILYASAGAYNNKIYLVTGSDNRDKPSSANDCYDIETDTWSSKTSAPTASTASASAVIGSKLHIMHGTAEGFPTRWTNIHECYDMETDTWSSKKICPENKRQIQSCVLNSKIYVLGGLSNNDSRSNSAYSYDSDTDTWSGLPQLRTKRSDFVCASSENRIFLIGGLATSFSSSMTDIYDILKNEWYSTLGIPGSAIYALGGFVWPYIYVFGGQCYGGGGDTNDVTRVDIFGSSFSYILRGDNKLSFNKDVIVGDEIIPAGVETSLSLEEPKRLIFREVTTGYVESTGEVEITN